MNPEFEQCLKRNKIREFPRGKALLTKTLEIAQRDLERAEKTFNDKDYKWATIQSYYSIFFFAYRFIITRITGIYCISSKQFGLINILGYSYTLR
jgi:uncharacterized protein (UPF0332 family)